MNDNFQESPITIKQNTATNESWRIQDVLSGLEFTSSKDGIEIVAETTVGENGGR